jgi:hypothetical protein
VNWIIFGAGYLNLDLIVRVEFRNDSMILSTPFRDFIVTDPGDIDRVQDRMHDMACRWMLSDPSQVDAIRRDLAKSAATNAVAKVW